MIYLQENQVIALFWK